MTKAADAEGVEELRERKGDQMIEGRLRVRNRDDRTFPFTLQFLPNAGPGGAWPEKRFSSEQSLFNFLKHSPLNLNLNEWINIQSKSGRRGNFRVSPSYTFEVYYEEGECLQELDSVNFWNLMGYDFFIVALTIPVKWGKENDLLPSSFSL